MSIPFKDHFSAVASSYAAHRPTYPPGLVDVLADLSPGHGLALDAGCGTGQLSVLLAGRFDRVVATDASASQIAHVQAHPQVEYRVAPAEGSGLPDRSVDLVTVAQAAHWFDLPRFYDDVRRIARDGGVLALVSYGVLHVDGEPDRHVQQFYGQTLGPHWPSERRHVEEGYHRLPFPFPEIDVSAPDMQAEWALDDLLGYVGTWSAVRALERTEGRKPFDEFQEVLARSWGNPRKRRTVRWPLSLRVGRIRPQAPIA
jgi:SAM-dependent methyltransferase